MKIEKILILSLIALATVLQCTLLNNIRIFGIKPDMLLILVIFFSLYKGRIYGLAVGLLCALFSEATSGFPAAALVFAYALGGLLLGHIGSWIYNHKVSEQICISFIFCSAIYLLLFLLLRISDIKLSFIDTLIYIILPACFYTAGITPLAFLFLKNIYPFSLRESS